MIHYYRYLFVKMKVFNYSELHFAEVTFYKIHTLSTSYIELMPQKLFKGGKSSMEETIHINTLLCKLIFRLL